MCVGIPMQIVTCDDLVGTATDRGETVQLDLALTGPLAAGTWVLTHLGSAREVISDDEARLIADALDGLRDVMSGGTGGDAFADIDARGPQLPPHLAAAQAAGKTHA